MADEKEELMYSERLKLACWPAVITGLIVVIGFWIQWQQFDRKRADDKEQFFEKMKSDQDNFLRTLQAAQEQTDKQRAKEFRLRYYERQTAFLMDLSDTVSRLASVQKPMDGKKDCDHLYQLLFGQLLIMADEDIRSRSATLYTNFRFLLNNPNVPISDENRVNYLSNNAILISWQCRKLLEKTFDLDTKHYTSMPPIQK